MIRVLLSLLSVGSSLGYINSNKGSTTSSYDYRNSDKPWEDKCTTMAIGKTATSDGSTVCTDTMVSIFISFPLCSPHDLKDCSDCDWRVGKVEARDWPADSMRPIYAEGSAYPRYIRDDRGSTWTEKNLEDSPLKEEWIQNKAPIIGHIPQVPHTYAVLEGLYGYMNEHQVSMGESTCAAKLFAAPVGWNDGKALLNIGDLIQLGLERGATAREAIQVMGDLAVKYGFYGESFDPTKYGAAYVMGEAGEALSVIDPNEAWIFHILPDDTGTSAVWVAQRVPDNHIAVVANSFIIRRVVPDSPDFMYSNNLFDVAKRQGFWDPSETSFLDFKTTYAPERYHPEYSNNRVWRVFSLSSPSTPLPLETNPDADDYPFSIAPDHPLTLQEIMDFQRDVYQGTSLDLTKGLAAGPWGDPNRYQNNAWGNMTIWDTLEGTFPRSISLFRSPSPLSLSSRPSSLLEPPPQLLLRLAPMSQTSSGGCGCLNTIQTCRPTSRCMSPPLESPRLGPLAPCMYCSPLPSFHPLSHLTLSRNMTPTWPGGTSVWWGTTWRDTITSPSLLFASSRAKSNPSSMKISSLLRIPSRL
jgi:dipeptidase